MLFVRESPIRMDDWGVPLWLRKPLMGSIWWVGIVVFFEFVFSPGWSHHKRPVHVWYRSAVGFPEDAAPSLSLTIGGSPQRPVVRMIRCEKRKPRCHQTMGKLVYFTGFTMVYGRYEMIQVKLHGVTKQLPTMGLPHENGKKYPIFAGKKNILKQSYEVTSGSYSLGGVGPSRSYQSNRQAKVCCSQTQGIWVSS